MAGAGDQIRLHAGAELLPEELNLACITPFPEVETAIHLKPDD